MSASRPLHACTWSCSWRNTQMCAQHLVNAQALEDGRVTLGVLCGLKRLYQPHSLPPCVVKMKIDWSGGAAAETAAAA